MTDPRVIRCYDDLVDCFKARKEELGLSNEFMDTHCVIVPGHTDKALGPARIKGMGRQTMNKFFEMLAIQFVPQPDADQEARMRPVWEGREHWNVRVSKRVSKPMLELARPIVAQQFAHDGGVARAACLQASKRSAIARKGGLARARARRQRLKDALREPAIRRGS